MGRTRMVDLGHLPKADDPIGLFVQFTVSVKFVGGAGGVPVTAV